MKARQAEDAARERCVTRSEHPTKGVNLDETQMGRRRKETPQLDKHGPMQWSQKSPGPTGSRAKYSKCECFNMYKGTVQRDMPLAMNVAKVVILQLSVGHETL